jgi:RNA 3'-terminal phosphate cyclase
MQGFEIMHNTCKKTKIIIITIFIIISFVNTKPSKMSVKYGTEQETQLGILWIDISNLPCVLFFGITARINFKSRFNSCN